MTQTGVHYLRVRYAETDQMGVAHHGAYIPWLEEARTEWMRERGRSYRSIEAGGFKLSVTRVSIRYLAPARYDDRLRITTRLVTRHPASITLGYELRRVEEVGDPAEATMLAEAETRLAYLDARDRPTRLPEDWFGG